jgi:hypothetical protein
VASSAETNYPNCGCQTCSGTTTAGGGRISSMTVSFAAGTFLVNPNQYATWTGTATRNNSYWL